MANIKIIGVGGGGSNILNKIIESGLSGVDFIAINFDWQALETSKAPVKIRLQSAFRGLDDPGKEHRQKDFLTQKYEVRQAIGAADAVIIVAGLGGGTGSDVSPMVMDIAKEQGTLTAGIVNTPLRFEGAHRKVQALEAVKEICDRADIAVVVSADAVLRKANPKSSVESAFNLLDETVSQAVRHILSFITDGLSPE